MMISMDAQTQAGILGQLAGHAVVWGKQSASGTPISQILTGPALFWAAFNIASETLSATATSLTGSQIAGVVAPGAVQIAALSIRMYDDSSKQAIAKLSRGELTSVLDSPFLAGSLGSVIAKSYA
jgi:hypothetical protein